MIRKIKIPEKSKKEKWDQVYNRISWWDSERIGKATVMVVGAGALGNEVLKNLALLNVGFILIVDFDTIEYSNLSRSVLFRESDCGQRKAEVAARKVKELNPNVKVKYIHGDIAFQIGLGVFRQMDVVIGCLDNRVARLYINRHCFKVGKTWIDGAIENLAGQLDVFKPGVSCFECQLDDRELGIIRYREGCNDVAERNATFGKIPTTPISSSVIGALQVQEALKVIFGNERQSMAGERFKFEGMNNMFLQYKSRALKEDCISHVYTGEIIKTQDLSCENTISETLDWLEKHFSDPDPEIILDYGIALELTGENSQESHEVVLAKPLLSNDLLLNYQKIPGERIIITREHDGGINKNFVNTGLKLKDIGIPPLQIITVETKDDIQFVELAGDESYLTFE